jgi:hypothetical protein
VHSNFACHSPTLSQRAVTSKPPTGRDWSRLASGGELIPLKVWLWVCRSGRGSVSWRFCESASSFGHADQVGHYVLPVPYHSRGAQIVLLGSRPMGESADSVFVLRLDNVTA